MITNQINYNSDRLCVYHSDSITENMAGLSYPYKIINIVALGLCTFREGFVLNFDNLSSEIEFKRLNRFPCIMFKIDNISCILFKNGKIILTGIKTHEQIPPLKQKILETLEILKIPVQGDIEITIQNLVAMTNLHKTINLEMLCLSLDNCIYEPE